MHSNLIFLIALICGLAYCERAYFPVTEESSIGTEIYEVSKYLKGRITNSDKFTIIGDPKFQKCISIQQQTGKTTVVSRIDREELCPGSQQIEQSNQKCIQSLRLIIVTSSSKDGLDIDFEIIDINDNTPSWSTALIRIPYPESEQKKSIKLPLADDKDYGTNAVVKYSLFTENKDSINFNLELRDNRLLLTPKYEVDFETKRFYNLTIIAEDRGVPIQSSSLIVEINVIDVNDNKPVFTQNVFRPTQPIYETTNIDTTLLKITAIDKDSGRNGMITYHIDPSMPNFIKNQFNLNAITGDIKLKQKLDYDKGMKFYKFIVIAKDSAPEPYELSSSTSVEIQVADVNDEVPQIHIYFTGSQVISNKNGIVSINVSENMPQEQYDLAHIQVEDADQEDKHFIQCFINNKESFKLQPDNVKPKGFILSASRSFDREQQQTERVRITCKDNGKNENSKDIIINITDMNDNDPVFNGMFVFNVNENMSHKYTEVGQITAKDNDSGVNAEITYRIVSIYPRPVASFRLDQKSGKLYIDQTLDREEQDHYNITVVAVDGGDPRRTGTGFVVIKVTDINDWPPVFDSPEYKFRVSEEVPINTKIGNVHASDRDSGKNSRIAYHFIADSLYAHQRTSSLEKFHINPSSGDIITTSRLDRESRSSFLLIVEAMNHGTPRSYSSSTTIHILVDDYNDNAPRFYSPANSSLITIDTDRSIGSEIIQFRANDMDEHKNSNIVYTIVSATDPYMFNLDFSSGILFLAKKPESSRKFRIVVKACDTGLPRKCSEDLHVYISTTKPAYIDQDSGTDFNIHRTNAGESNSAIIACLAVIFVILLMAMIVMFFLIRNKHMFWKRRMDQNYEKAPVSDIQVRNIGDQSFTKKDTSSVYDGDLLLLNERNVANNLSQNCRYSPKIYAESHLAPRPDSPCYRTVDVLASSVYNPATGQIDADCNQLQGTIQTVSRMNMYPKHFRGASEPVYRYSNITNRNAFTSNIHIYPYYQSIASPGTATLRFSRKSNELNNEIEQENVILNYDARTLPRSLSLMKFYEKNAEKPEHTTDKSPNYQSSSRPKYAYEALREGSFI